MRRLVLEQKLGLAATVCPDGTPNLSPKGTTTVWDDTHLDVTKGEHDESLRRRSEPCDRRPARPQLNDAGHEVIGTHNSPASGEHLRKLGAKPVPLDLLDARAVRNAVVESEHEAVVQEATALANAKFWPRQHDDNDAPDPGAETGS
jgi:hypothetical protein